METKLRENETENETENDSELRLKGIERAILSCFRELERMETKGKPN